mmetsp:Transcript_1542/g.3114  ORF Transcript_1542/g.3114 Transcript_1542/m.3114 type:complete len:84 (-) Transcript_1542:2-253(-)
MHLREVPQISKQSYSAASTFVQSPPLDLLVDSGIEIKQGHTLNCTLASSVGERRKLSAVERRSEKCKSSKGHAPMKLSSARLI